MKETLTLAEFDQKLQGLAAPITDFTPALKSTKQIIIAGIADNFDEERTPDGQPWEELQHARHRTRDKRKGRKGRDKILNDMGTLRRSETASGAPGNIDNATPTSLEWGSNDEKAIYHQQGTNKWKGKFYYDGPVDGGMVARPFSGLNSAMEEDIEDALARFVVRKIGGAF